MNNLRKFATEADYSAATLNYPAVSWVVSGDTVHYDKTSGDTPTPPNDKFMIGFTALDTYAGDIVLWNGGTTDWYADLTAMTINDTAIENPDYTYSLDNYNFVQDQSYVVKYSFNENSQAYTSVSQILTGVLGGGWGSGQGFVDFLVPAQVTEIDYMPANTAKLVVEATTHPSVNLDFSSWNDQPIYVPDDAVNSYKSAWSDVASFIHPISEYNGVLPI